MKSLVTRVMCGRKIVVNVFPGEPLRVSGVCDGAWVASILTDQIHALFRLSLYLMTRIRRIFRVVYVDVKTAFAFRF